MRRERHGVVKHLSLDIDRCLNLLELTYNKYNNGLIANKFLMWKRREERDESLALMQAYIVVGPYIK
jgi:hypothetical protein